MTKVDPAEVRARLEAVITAMKDTGAWEVQRPAEEAFVDMGAFGMRTMAFEQWLRWVFVPSIEGRLSHDGPWPDDSSVAAHAVRETDGNDRLQPLVETLGRFDELFEKPPEIDPEVHRLLLAARFDEALVALNEVHPSAPYEVARVAEQGAVRARVHGTRAQALALLEQAHRGELANAAIAARERDAPDAHGDADRLEARLEAWRAEG